MTSTEADSKQFTQDDLDGIIEELEYAGNKIPEDAIRRTRQHRDQVVPRLIEAIQRATQDVRQGGELDGDAHFFALFLLTEFRAKEALPAILEAVSLPGEGPFDVFGDAITSLLPRTLVAVTEDAADLLDTLIRNDELNEYVRWEAAEAYCYLVREGSMERKEAVERLGCILREAIDRDDWQITSYLITVLSHLWPREAYDDIKQAFERDLVETFLVRLEDVDEVIANGEAGMRERFDREPPTCIDTIEELSTWAGYQEEPKRPFTPPYMPAPEPARAPRSEADVTPARVDPADSDVSRPRAGRNDPCPCGSGKKFKKCCGSPQARASG